jgi:hypothetical protein
VGTYLIGLFGNSNGSADLSRTTTVDDTVVLDKVTDNANGIVKRTLGLVDDLCN